MPLCVARAARPCLVGVDDEEHGRAARATRRLGNEMALASFVLFKPEPIAIRIEECAEARTAALAAGGGEGNIFLL